MNRFMMAAMVAMLASTPIALAGITVLQTRAEAGTNAWAPLDQSMYFDNHVMENTLPAVVDAAGDWTGTNIGGSTPTWHWIGSAHADESVSATPTEMSVSGNGAYSWEATTTADFVSPNHVAFLYGPGSGSRFYCRFNVDAPATYRLSGVLMLAARFSLYAWATDTAVYGKTNNLVRPLPVDVTGILPPGEYTAGAIAGYGGDPQASAHESHSGGFNNFRFTVQVPEPAIGFAWLLVGWPLLRRGGRN